MERGAEKKARGKQERRLTPFTRSQMFQAFQNDQKMHKGPAFQTLHLSFARKELFHPKRKSLTEAGKTQETPNKEKSISQLIILLAGLVTRLNSMIKVTLHFQKCYNFRYPCSNRCNTTSIYNLISGFTPIIRSFAIQLRIQLYRCAIFFYRTIFPKHSHPIILLLSIVSPHSLFRKKELPKNQ